MGKTTIKGYAAIEYVKAYIYAVGGVQAWSCSFQNIHGVTDYIRKILEEGLSDPDDESTFTIPRKFAVCGVEGKHVVESTCSGQKFLELHPQGRF